MSARRRHGSLTSSRVLHARYTYGLCTAVRECERVIHLVSQYRANVLMCVIIWCPHAKYGRLLGPQTAGCWCVCVCVCVSVCLCLCVCVCVCLCVLPF